MSIITKWIIKEPTKAILLSFYLLIAGLGLFAIEYAKPNIKNKNDLDIITGTFYDYHWDKHFKGSSLTFNLKEYNVIFKIKADFFQILKHKAFINIQKGEKINLGIPKDFSKKINESYYFVYSITSEKDTFLDYEEAIKIHNSLLLEICALFFVLLALTLLIIRHKVRLKLANL